MPAMIVPRFLRKASRTFPGAAIVFVWMGVMVFAPAGFAEDGFAAWKEEYKRVCARVAEGESLSVAELDEALKACDVLSDRLEAMDTPQKKLYRFRLKKCRDFLDYLRALKVDVHGEADMGAEIEAGGEAPPD